MLLATILLLSPFPQSGDIAKTVVERPASVSVEATKDSSPAKVLPSAPEPKIKSDVEIADASSPAPVAPAAAAEPIGRTAIGDCAGPAGNRSPRKDVGITETNSQWPVSGKTFQDVVPREGTFRLESREPLTNERIEGI